ncbi:dephospho-CoA kinase [Sphingobacterium sp. HJSM2_6]|uniref:dephospho-CoA kinase n=1 Tax=Sphingobacterium sp. HJSM2_6 TaxID=3366264 RepID=UPI003BBA0AD7
MGLKIGITGGIGTGKSLIARVFKLLGVPTYDADLEAKLIMTKSDEVRAQLIEVFGSEVYLEDGTLNRSWLADRVFSDSSQLTKLNAIVHPAVIQDAEDWAQKQTSLYSLKEAALLFESGSYRSLDYTILVVAPEDLRIKRVMARDHITEQAVRARMAKQMPEEDKATLADFILYNDSKHSIIEQVMELHHQFTLPQKP